jgi:hypothetical protein
MTHSQLTRFVAKIQQQVNGCWQWTASKTSRRLTTVAGDEHIDGGYGLFWLDGKTVVAHRVAYEHWIRLIPDGLEIDHLCRNRGCVNPLHLEPVTHSLNMQRGERPKAPCALTRERIRRAKIGKPRPWTDEWRSRLAAAKALKGQRSHCKHGHLYDVENTYWRTEANGRRSRMCRQCYISQRRLNRQKAQAIA